MTLKSLLQMSLNPQPVALRRLQRYQMEEPPSRCTRTRLALAVQAPHRLLEEIACHLPQERRKEINRAIPAPLHLQSVHTPAVNSPEQATHPDPDTSILSLHLFTF
jgi:hypothetical protein